MRCVDVLQRSRADADTDADNGRSYSGAGTDPRRGNWDARWIQHQRDAGAQKSLSHRADLRRRRHLRSIHSVYYVWIYYFVVRTSHQGMSKSLSIRWWFNAGNWWKRGSSPSGCGTPLFISAKNECLISISRPYIINSVPFIKWRLQSRYADGYLDRYQNNSQLWCYNINDVDMIFGLLEYSGGSFECPAYGLDTQRTRHCTQVAQKIISISLTL